MANLIYSAITSLDGYVEDADGGFDWAAPDDEVHAFINDLERPVGTYLYGRRMYESMVYWETAHTGSQPAAVFARLDAAMAGDREDRLLQDPRRPAQRASANRARVRSRRSAAALRRPRPRRPRSC